MFDSSREFRCWTLFLRFKRAEQYRRQCSIRILRATQMMASEAQKCLPKESNRIWTLSVCCALAPIYHNDLVVPYLIFCLELLLHVLISCERRFSVLLMTRRVAATIIAVLNLLNDVFSRRAGFLLERWRLQRLCKTAQGRYI